MKIAIAKVGQEFKSEDVIKANISRSSSFDSKSNPRRIFMSFQGKGENQDVIVNVAIDHNDFKALSDFEWEQEDI